jgi:hypothetical protein
MLHVIPGRFKRNADMSVYLIKPVTFFLTVKGNKKCRIVERKKLD